MTLKLLLSIWSQLSFFGPFSIGKGNSMLLSLESGTTWKIAKKTKYWKFYSTGKVITKSTSKFFLCIEIFVMISVCWVPRYWVLENSTLNLRWVEYWGAWELLEYFAKWRRYFWYSLWWKNTIFKFWSAACLSKF